MANISCQEIIQSVGCFASTVPKVLTYKLDLGLAVFTSNALGIYMLYIIDEPMLLARAQPYFCDRSLFMPKEATTMQAVIMEKFCLTYMYSI